MNDALNLLQLGLAQSFAVGVRAPESWSDLAGMGRALAQVQREHGGAGIAANPRSIMSAIADFRKTGEVAGVRDLKYVCLGVGLVDGRGWCVLGDPKLRSEVVELVQRQPEMRRRLRCFQALLSSYWTFPLNDPSISAEAVEGWRELRLWLRSERATFVKSKEPKPPWFGGLERHGELLSDQPCEGFGAALLRGDSSGLNDAIESLAIPKESWVMHEAVFAQMKAATELNDNSFKEALTKLLPIAMGNSGVEIGKTLRIRCIARLVSRYAKCEDRPEQLALRDAAISTIGNPWLRRAQWDAFVVDEKRRPDDQAREMVNGWLKRRLISDFFVLLSVDGTGDPRRLQYWLRFEPLIDDMWFALGTDARFRRDEHFNDFRTRARGRLLDLEDSTADNNAFVMRIGEYLAVEFGATGNAFFLFRWDSVHKLVHTLTSGLAHAKVSRAWLKMPNHELRLIHIDSARETWEQKFDAEICPKLGWPNDPPRRAGRAGPRTPRPTSPVPKIVRAGSDAARGPTQPEWDSFVKLHRLFVLDQRPSKGALWVFGEDYPRLVTMQLKIWGFRLRPGRGWYKE